MPAAAANRRFSVHGIEELPSHGHLVDGASFEDAALHYLGGHHPDGAADEVSLFVEDCETGERQCFRIDLTTGETQPCD